MTDTALQTRLRQTREATVKEHVDAENRHDPTATVATSPTPRPAMTFPRSGRQARYPITMRSGSYGWACFPCFPISISKLDPCDMATTTFSLRFV